MTGDSPEESTAPLIRLDRVTVRAGGRSLFSDTNWTFRADQHWAVLGPNGSGKSLLASALCRQVHLSAGRILFAFDTDDPSRSYARRGEIVRIAPEDHAALTSGSYHQARWNSIEGADAPTVSDLLTGESIEHFSTYQVGPTRIPAQIYRQRRDRAVARLGIGHLLDRKVLHLSNGEGRKLLLARALMQSPHLLILDDPFGGLDGTSRQALRQTVDELLASGGPRLLVLTSRPDEVPDGVTHLLCVDGCRIVARGTRDQVFTNPAVERLFSHGARPGLPGIIFPASERRPPADSVLIDMKDTTISYDGVRILDRIEWTVRSGERWSLRGPNGAGKTTLLSLVLADNPQAYGNNITLFGRRRGSGESIWEIKRRIGWVAPELQRHYSASIPCAAVVRSGFFDSVGLYRTCTPEQRATARDWMRALALEGFADRAFGSVSAGEQRQVLLARALVKDPELLILDEPCQGLDVVQRGHVVSLVDQLCEQTGITLIYMTHRSEELPRSITHQIALENGRVIACGPRSEANTRGTPP